jgi:RsiW-degrading membrane proteinase PrsW (M82 family)
MIFIYIIIAIFISWIWIDYFRLIDIYNPEKIKYILLVFFLGCTSVLLVLGAQIYILDFVPFELNGSYINDFVYCVFRIGLLEELAKSAPLLIIFYFYKHEIDEPIDFLAFFSFSALGFAASENVLYFLDNGGALITPRAILSTVGHMFDTSLIAYGFILNRYKYKQRNIFVILQFILLAALSHGFYDFWLINEEVSKWGWFVTVLYFMFTISIFATILNNSLNNSSHFTYKKAIDADAVLYKILKYYGVLFLVQIIVLTFQDNFIYALSVFKFSLFTVGFIIAITVERLSKFKLIEGKWNELKFEIPFLLENGKLRIKGDTRNEVLINMHYEDYFLLHPVSQNNTYIGTPRLAYLEKKVFLKNDDAFYLIKCFTTNENGAYEYLLLYPKTTQATLINDKYPIVSILELQQMEDLNNVELTKNHFPFIEFAFLKPQTK